MNRSAKRLIAEKILDTFQREVEQSRLSLHGHVSKARQELRALARANRVRVIQITGRAKSRESAIAKLLDTPEASLGRGSLAGMDRVGLRIVVATDTDLSRMLAAMSTLAFHLKDYVAQPRLDGLLLGGDPGDVYRGYHLFTRQLTGIPIEVQLFTLEMRRAGIRLKRKYGNEYWKSIAFRRRRVKSGDLR